MKILNKHVFFLLVFLINSYNLSSSKIINQASEKVLINEKVAIEGKILREDNDAPISNMVVKINVQGIPEEFSSIDNVSYVYTDSEGFFSLSVYIGYYINTYSLDGSLFSTNGPFKFSYFLSINWDENGHYNDNYKTKTDNIGSLNSGHYRIYHLSTR